VLCSSCERGGQAIPEKPVLTLIVGAALSKVLLAYENGVIPANLHYHEPNPNCDSLKNGVVKVKVLALSPVTPLSPVQFVDVPT
jgi:hypothetical protein